MKAAPIIYQEKEPSAFPSGRSRTWGPNISRPSLRRGRPVPSAGLEDFCRRVRLPRNIIPNLILVGAFDGLHPNRRALLWQLGRGDGTELLPPPQIEDFSPYQKFLYEYSLLGLTAGGHLIGFFAPQARAAGHPRQGPAGLFA